MAKRPTGYGKGLDTPPVSMPDLNGIRDKRRGNAGEGGMSVDPDGTWPGNVVGMLSQPVMGKAKGKKR